MEKNLMEIGVFSWRMIKKNIHTVFKLLNQFYSGEGEKILLKEKQNIRKLLSEAALEKSVLWKILHFHPTLTSILH